MPEQDKNEKALPGDTSVSRSSDAYIAGNLSQIEGEVYAVNNSEVEIDVYTPKNIGSEMRATNNDTITPQADFSGESAGYAIPAQVNPIETGLYSLAHRISKKKIY